MFKLPCFNHATAVRQYWVLRDKKKQENDHFMPRWMTPEFATFSGEFVMHKSINVFESVVTRVGSVINWLRPYISKMFIRWEEFTAFASGRLLTKKLPMFLSRLNEINGGCKKILPVSGSFWSNLKFFYNDWFHCVVVRVKCESGWNSLVVLSLWHL